MNSVIIVMTILGCGQTDAACEYIRTSEATYASRAECEANTQVELMQSGSDGYPSVIAVCEPRRNEVVAIPNLQDPSTNRQVIAVAEPKVIRMPEAAKPKDPVAWSVNQTRKLVGGVKKLATATWRGLTGGLKPNRDPLLLSEYLSADR